MKMERKVPRRCQEVFCIKFDFGKGVGEKRMLNFWIFYLFTLSILSWCSRDLAAQTGDVFWVRVIVPVIKEVMALWSFHPRLTHCSFKNSTPVSAAGLVDPRVSQFGLYEIHVINFWTFRRCLIDTIEISVLGVRWGFDWALIGHIRVGYLSKRLKFYFAMVLLYTVRVKKKKRTRDQPIQARSYRRTDRYPTHQLIPHRFDMQH